MIERLDGNESHQDKVQFFYLINQIRQNRRLKIKYFKILKLKKNKKVKT